MTVNEIRDAREALEQKILKLCEEFRAEIGFAVTGCEIQSVEGRHIGDKHPRRITSAVSIELESI